MTRYSDRPYHNDVVKGGNTPPPVKDAALGGLEGIRRRLQVASSEDKKVAVLRDVLRYGNAGRDLLKQIVKAESGAVQVAAYCLLNFDSQATEIESQEILGVINAAVQRAIDTRIEVRQVSSPNLQDEANTTITAITNSQKTDSSTVVSNPDRIHSNNSSDRTQQPAAKSSSDRIQLPSFQPPSQARIAANQNQSSTNRSDRPLSQSHQANSNPRSKQTKLSKRDKKDGKNNQGGLKKWLNQTLGISDQ
jgi:hypothetical protein